jgi:predicted nucleic acid-binding Zn ribbon protein
VARRTPAPGDLPKIGALIVPMYVYRRRDGSTFELEQRITVDALLSCPTTGQRVERVMQPFTARFNGPGFYTTDNRKSAPGSSTQSAPSASDSGAPSRRSGTE